MPPKVVVNVPASLRTTPRQRTALKKVFKDDIKTTMRNIDPNPVTNVGRVVTEVIVDSGASARAKRGAKRKAAKKAGKKR